MKSLMLLSCFLLPLTSFGKPLFLPTLADVFQHIENENGGLFIRTSDAKIELKELKPTAGEIKTSEEEGDTLDFILGVKIKGTEEGKPFKTNLRVKVLSGVSPSGPSLYLGDVIEAK